HREGAQAHGRSVRVGDQLANDLDPRPMGGGAAAFPASSPPHAHPLRRGEARRFIGEPRLADAGFSREQHESAAAGARIVDRCAYLCELPLPAYEVTRPLIRLAMDRFQNAKRSGAVVVGGQRNSLTTTLAYRSGESQPMTHSGACDMAWRVARGRPASLRPVALSGVSPEMVEIVYSAPLEKRENMTKKRGRR